MNRLRRSFPSWAVTAITPDIQRLLQTEFWYINVTCIILRIALLSWASFLMFFLIYILFMNDVWCLLLPYWRCCFTLFIKRNDCKICILEIHVLSLYEEILFSQDTAHQNFDYEEILEYRFLVPFLFQTFLNSCNAIVVHRNMHFLCASFKW